MIFKERKNKIINHFEKRIEEQKNILHKMYDKAMKLTDDDECTVYLKTVKFEEDILKKMEDLLKEEVNKL